MGETVPAARAGQSGPSAAKPAPPDVAVDPDPNVIYALGSSSGESVRLRVGLRPGDSALDLACGPRGVIDLRSSRAALSGASSSA